MIAALNDNEGKYAFEKTAIELYKQPKTKIRKKHIRLVKESVGVDVVSMRFMS